MTRVIREVRLRNGVRLTTALVKLGYRGGVTGSVRHQVHDGDTIVTRAEGNFGVRFVGVDAPEVSFTFPGSDRFVHINDARWEPFLADPFDNQYGEFNVPLSPGLAEDLKRRCGPGTGLNHHEHAMAAEDALEAEIAADIKRLKQTEAEFQFFLTFADEILDRYGRFLAFINCYDETDDRPVSYNERMLQAGVVSPYFIFPNVDPFLRAGSVVAAASTSPSAFRKALRSASALQKARGWVKSAREGKRGVFDRTNPLRLQAFEIRFLAQRRVPNRWVIDLSKDDNLLLMPQQYYTVENLEDRMYIPEEYVPLLVERGWVRQT